MKKLRPYQAKAVNETLKALEDVKPVLLMASVGAGKSLMLARILLKYQQEGKRCLCLINNAELVRSNTQAFREEGGVASIFCASLKEKDCSESVVIASAQSVYASIEKEIGKIKFDLIVVDEAHAIAYDKPNSTFMKLLVNYFNSNPSLRVLGATGTNFRFKGATIVGKDAFFKKQTGNITTQQLINTDYLVPPRFQVDPDLLIDFSKVKITNGKFNGKDLEKVIEASHRLTYLICEEIQNIIKKQNRFGAFIFASTRNHAKEIYSYLPENETGLILGDTTQDEREIMLNKARNGEIKYLVNISVLTVGIDVPSYDTIAYLRPTESLVLMVQTMGRGLRLSPQTNKTDALVLDYAGNIERHQDWDDPLLLKALQQTRDKDEEYDIECPACHTRNTFFSRRCIGTKLVKKDNEEIKKERCEYFFEYKECEECNAQNDITARICRKCDAELIDPNDKLRRLGDGVTKVYVRHATSSFIPTRNGFVLGIDYECLTDGHATRRVAEKYIVTTPKARNFFYGKFLRPHFEKAYKYYPKLDDADFIKEIIPKAKMPEILYIKKEDDKQWETGNWRILDKEF